ncbi:MAG: class I tRNA ligase family protein, partial [Planctomycetota bacterium]|nr:class I tRNA ligase family protein [Planctomycetota bacterium]
GLKMEDARKAVVKEFEARGLLEATKPYRQTKSISDRSGAIIEPYLSDQWYVKVTDPRMAPAANEALRAGELTFHPERYAKTYEQWHDGIRDWCISRQLWWGHRIPVWTGGGTLPAGVSAAISRGDASSAQASEGRTHVCLRREDAALAAELEKAGFVQDADVLDTWFSSALWPMSTMGWPEPDKAAEIEGDPSLRDLLRAFNPTSVLCTAREIITLWVSRMVMFNHVFLGKDGRKGPVPFRDVFIHAVIQDGEGRKMSKSLGNGVDPLDIIATHGSDAMRFTLCHMATDTQDVRLPVMKDSATGANTSPKFDLGRNFCNKLWNAARFAMQNLRADDGEAPIDPSKLSLVDHWMLSRLTQGLADAEKALSEYRFSDYAQAIYDLMWRDFCDWYLEIVKPTVGEDRGQRAVLRAALDTIVRLLHPVAPYVTEVIWERLSTYPQPAIPGLTLSPARKGGTLCTAGWPELAPTLRNEHAEAQFEDLRALVTGIREVRAQHNVPPKRKVSLHGPGGEIKKLMIFPGIVETLGGLGKANNTMPDDATPHVAFTVGGVEFRLSDLADAVDAGADRARLEKQIADLAKSIATLEGRLANPGYTDRAPPAMVQQTRDQLAKAQAERDAAQRALARLGT